MTLVVKHSVFFGVYPDAGPALRARQRRLGTDFGIRGGLTDRLHISLVGLGDSVEAPGPPWIDDIASMAAGVRMPAFKISLDRLMSFRGSKRVRPVVLTGEDGALGLSMLCDLIGAALRAEGVGHRAASTPHVTLAWSAIVVPEQHVEPVTWTAREFFLIDSLQGAGRHDVLGQWALRGPDGDLEAVDFGPLFGPNSRNFRITR
jgi:2'-5' RNA ligase